MPKSKLAVAGGKLRRLIHRGTDSALLDSRRKPGQDYRTSSTSSPNSDNSPRVSRESSLRRRRSSLNTLDDNGQPAASGGNRRITVSSIFPSSTSLEASSHHSASLNSLSSGIDYLTHTTPDHHAPLDRNGIISVTKDVQHFLAAVSNLKKALKMEKDSAPDNYIFEHFEEHQRELARRHLAELTRVVKEILAHHHQGMRSTAVTEAIKDLADAFNASPHEKEDWKTRCSTSLEQLTDSFTTSVQDYMQGDCDLYTERDSAPPQRSRTGGAYNPGSLPNLVKGFSRSHDNLLASQFQDGSRQTVSEEFISELDHAMLTRADAITLTMTNCKHRLKYLRTVTGYLRKRAQIEADYYRQLDKLGKQTKESLNELQVDTESSMPLLDVFCESIDADVHYGKMSDTTFNLQVGHKLTEPLSRKNCTNQLKMKELKENWNKEQKKLNDAKSALNNSRQKYFMLGGEIVKARLVVQDGPPHKVEKKRRELLDLEAKFAEAEQSYRRLVEEANGCQYQVHTAQKSILCALRRLIIETDQIVMMGFENYFNIQHRFFQQFPKVRQTLREKTMDFDIGRDFYEFVTQHMEVPAQPRDFYFQELNLEDLITEAVLLNRATAVVPSVSADVPSVSTPVIISEPVSTGSISNGIGSITPDSDMSPATLSPYHSSSHEDTPHRESVDYSPVPHPRNSRNSKKQRPQSFYGNTSKQKEGSFWKEAMSNLTSQKASGIAVSVGDIRALQSQSTPSSSQSRATKSAKTHTFHKLETPARCKECDTLVYFDGVECTVCGLVVHQRCQEFLAIVCGSKLMKQKLSMFGVDFHKHLEVTDRNIPILVCKCIKEIEQRALEVQGIYRLSGSKKKLEKLCQLFETAADRLDLTDQNPHLVASLLKTYLRHLPEPLMTFGLYKDFISIAKESLQVLPLKDGAPPEVQADGEELLKRLKDTLSLLPPEHYMTLLCLLYHLKRVASHSVANLMPESNLSIVFGPNLLKSKDPQSSMAALADMTYQAKLVEIMICHSAELFSATEEEVWGNASKEVEVVKEMYIPMELSERNHPMDEMDESDEEMDTPPNTPPERRLSNLDDLSAILLTITGDEDFVAVNGKRSSASIPEGMNIGTVPSQDYLTNTGRGSGRKSALSLQRMLTPVGEELAHTQSTAQQPKPSSLGFESELAILDVSDYDSDSFEGQSCDVSLYSMPFSDLGDTAGPTSTISLPLLQQTKSSASPEVLLDLEMPGSLGRKERFRNARKKDRMTARQLPVSSDVKGNDSTKESVGKEDSTEPAVEQPKPQPLQRSQSADEKECVSCGLSSPVQANFLSSSANVDITPEQKASEHDNVTTTVDQREGDEQVCDADFSAIPPPSPRDVEGDFFKRDDRSRIGVRAHSYPPRLKRNQSDYLLRWSTPQGNESLVSPSNFEDLIATDLCEALDDKNEEVVRVNSNSHVTGRRNRSDICEKDSLSEQSVVSIHQLVTPDSGNESTHTGEMRGSSSEGDLLEADRHKHLPIPNDLECDDDGIGVSPYMKKEEFFQLQSAVWEGSSDNSGRAHTHSAVKDRILSDSSIDIEILEQSTVDEKEPIGRVSDPVFPAQDDDQTSTECERSDDNQGEDSEVVFDTLKVEAANKVAEFDDDNVTRPHSSPPPQIKQVATPTITWRSLGSQSQSLKRADLFEDTFASEGKVAYSSILARPPKQTSLVSLSTEVTTSHPKRERACSEADLLVDRLKAMGAQPINERIKEWREREMKATRLLEEGSDRAKKKEVRQRKAQSCYDIDLSGSSEFTTLSQPLSEDHHSHSFDLEDAFVTKLDGAESTLEDFTGTKQTVQKLRVRVKRSPSFQNELLSSANFSD